MMLRIILWKSNKKFFSLDGSDIFGPERNIEE